MADAANNYGIVSQLRPEEDVWYVLRFDIETGTVVMTYYDQSLPIQKQRPIRKIVKRTYENSAPREAFSSVLSNLDAKRDDARGIQYEPTKVYDRPADKRWDLTDISNNIKKMPKDFRDHIFSVENNNGRIVIKSFISKLDIDACHLNTKRMNEYLNELEDFTVKDEGADWL